MTRPGKVPGALAALVAGAAFAGLACTGSVMGDGDSSGDDKGDDVGSNPTRTGGKGGTNTGGTGMTPNPPGGENSAGPGVFRRLTLIEYRNTVRDLLGEKMATESTDLAADTGTGSGFRVGAPFTNSVDALKVSDLTDKLVTAALAHPDSVLPKSCKLTSTAATEQDACVKEFIDTFALRAFRRPLTAAEKTNLQDLYKALRAPEAGATFQEAIGGMIRGLIQSPQFLYHWETGEPATKDGGLVKYGPYEVASRLSYFLWASMPDEDLFSAAAAKKLSDPKDIATQARRMLTHQNAKDGIQDFHEQWLEVAGLTGLTKDESYKDYTPAAAKAMQDETGAFVNGILWGDKATGKLTDLFTSNKSFVTGPLAKLYGLTNVTGDEMRPAELPANQRAGILTLGAFLASHADGDFSHPVKRGVTVLRHVVCQEIPSPDGIDVPTLPPRQEGQTTREHFSKHSSIGGICAGCHNAIDPMGFAFENYDAVGGYRTMEEGKKVDATGTLKLESTEIKFDGGVDLSKKLAETTELRDCVARHWLRYLLRRQELKAEKGSVDNLMKAFAESKWDVREMLVTLTTTRAFTHRQPFDGEVTK